jgi:hypothetical protein
VAVVTLKCDAVNRLSCIFAVQYFGIKNKRIYK